MRAAEAADAAKVLRGVLAEVAAGNVDYTAPRGGHLLRASRAQRSLEAATITRR